MGGKRPAKSYAELSQSERQDYLSRFTEGICAAGADSPVMQEILRNKSILFGKPVNYTYAHMMKRKNEFLQLACYCCFFLICAARGGLAEPTGNNPSPQRISLIPVEVAGRGVTHDEAYKDACALAVRTAIGSILHSKTVVTNDEIEEKIIIFSNAYIENCRELEARQEAGFFVVKISANVRSEKLQTALLNTGAGSEIRLNLNDQIAKINSKIDRINTEKALLDVIFKDFPTPFLSVSIGSPEVKDELNAELLRIRAPVKISIDSNSFLEFRKKLNRYLETVCLESSFISTPFIGVERAVSNLSDTAKILSGSVQGGGVVVKGVFPGVFQDCWRSGKYEGVCEPGGIPIFQMPYTSFHQRYLHRQTHQSLKDIPAQQFKILLFSKVNGNNIEWKAYSLPIEKRIFFNALLLARFEIEFSAINEKGGVLKSLKLDRQLLFGKDLYKDENRFKITGVGNEIVKHRDSVNFDCSILGYGLMEAAGMPHMLLGRRDYTHYMAFPFAPYITIFNGGHWDSPFFTDEIRGYVDFELKPEEARRLGSLKAMVKSLEAYRD